MDAVVVIIESLLLTLLLFIIIAHAGGSWCIGRVITCVYNC